MGRLLGSFIGAIMATPFIAGAAVGAAVGVARRRHWLVPCSGPEPARSRRPGLAKTPASTARSFAMRACARSQEIRRSFC